ncbi:MAG: alpha/beta hydrolase [Caulobacterales bacterium]
MKTAELAQVRAMLSGLASGLSLNDLRSVYDGVGAQFPTPPDVTLRPEQVGDVQAEWTSTPGANTDRAILYLHGGGFAVGSIQSHRHVAAELGRQAQAQTLSIDYRRAPERPFPAAADDCLAGYRFLLGAGFDPSRIAIAGDSAGGGLVVTTLVAAREAGMPQPACGLCMSAWVDLEAAGSSMTTKAAEDPLVQRESLLQMAAGYLAGADPRSPLASPLHADLRGLAPLLIQVGSAETLLDDSVRLAALAGAQGVDVRLEIWPDMVHTWHFFHPILGEGRRALGVAGDYLRDRMSRLSQAAAAA